MSITRLAIHCDKGVVIDLCLSCLNMGFFMNGRHHSSAYNLVSAKFWIDLFYGKLPYEVIRMVSNLNISYTKTQYAFYKWCLNTPLWIVITFLRTINSGQGQMTVAIFRLATYVLAHIIFMHGYLVLLEIIGMMLSLT